METYKSDILVLGSGAAGLFFALDAARFAETVVLTKKRTFQSNTYYAQGGIASVVGGDDSFELHVADTLAAGQGLCDREAVEIMVREGPDRLEELSALGVSFNRDAKSGSYILGREGGHSAPRIVHHNDVTGRTIEDTLIDEVERNKNIELREDHLAVDLIKDKWGAVRGCYVFDRCGGKAIAFLARHTVLATGGAGKIYLYTSNPDVATGDGIAMAYRAGATIANLEFVQFHPTCFYHQEVKSLLISETLRGEGAVLKNLEGEEFMERYDDRRELAPRDIVARSIDSEMKRSGDKNVLLDITSRPGDWLTKRFPYVFENCLRYGIDIRRDPIPVVPAAHYMCGGVKVDLNGCTDLPGLFAIGEVSCSGVHGANRLASNSLLEVLVVAKRCSQLLEKQPGRNHDSDGVGLIAAKIADAKALETVILDHDWDLTRRVMWDYVGIVRSEERLGIARQRIAQIRETVERLYREYGISGDLIELRNIALVSRLVVESALLRKESRGLHFMQEYPEPDPSWEKNTLMKLKRNTNRN